MTVFLFKIYISNGLHGPPDDLLLYAPDSGVLQVTPDTSELITRQRDLDSLRVLPTTWPVLLGPEVLEVTLQRKIILEKTKIIN